MKTFKCFAYAVAIAIVGTALTACNNNPDGPQGNYKGETVKSQFIINLTQQSGTNGPNRMKAAEVQANEGSEAAFQGMDNIVLIPFAVSGADIASTDSRLAQNIDRVSGLTGFTSYDVDPSAADLAHAKVYEDIKIPLGTYSFLFYARAKNNTLDDSETTKDAYDQTDKFKFGQTHTAGITSATPAGITFNPVQIYPAGTEDAKATAIMAYLTSIANVTDAAPTSAAWSAGGNEGQQGWIDMYNTFVNYYNSAFHTYAASSASVQAMVIDLYESVNVQADDNTMAAAIKKAILNPTYVTNAATLDVTPAIATLPTFADAISGYPSNYSDHATNPSLGLPDGAGALIWDNSTHAFKIQGTYEWVAANGTGTMDVAKLDRYIYAPALCYYANSQIFTKETPQAANYVTAAAGASSSDAAWNQILTSLYGKGGSTAVRSVNAATQSVAIEKPINYGVGRLDVKLRASGAVLPDSKGRNHTLSTGSGIQFTGVLIGGQGTVGYNFSPASLGNFVIWDPNVDKSYNLGLNDWQAYPLNYTLAYETPATEKIRVAIEFENNMEDFFGVNQQLIPLGTKFYIVAELDPASGTAHANTQNKVILQDFTTLVKLSLSTLAKSYNVVPDLRTPQLELGFSVNLEWQQGYEFSISVD